jgi:hypothetical protein
VKSVSLSLHSFVSCSDADILSPSLFVTRYSHHGNTDRHLAALDEAISLPSKEAVPAHRDSRDDRCCPMVGSQKTSRCLWRRAYSGRLDPIPRLRR